MALLSDIRTANGQLIWKPQAAFVAVAPYTVAALVKSDIFDATTGVPKAFTAWPTGYVQLGWFTTDGLTFGRDTTVSDTNAFGALEPVRRTVTAQSHTLSLTPMESLRMVQQLYYLTSLTAVTPGTNNVINWQEPALPALRDYRLVAMGADTGQTAGEWIRVIQMPRVGISPNGDSSWNQADEGNTYPITATAQLDGTLGYAVEHFEGGAGFPATALGFA